MIMLLKILLLAGSILVVAHGANNHVPAIPEDCADGEFLQVCEDLKQVMCEFNCDNFRRPKKQLCPCVTQCMCKPQYVRNIESNKCIYRFQCPDTWWPWNGYH